MRGPLHFGIALTIILLAGLPAPAQPTLRTFLEGHWTGDGINIRVDQDAVQANDNPEKPFEWKPFNVLDVTGSMIVFEIGRRRYIGLIEGERMTVTIAGLQGSYLLTKVPAAPTLKPDRR